MNTITVTYASISGLVRIYDDKVLSQSLDSEELRRAERFSSAQRRAEFVVGRFLAKHLLQRATGFCMDSVQFGLKVHGKPYLIGTSKTHNYSGDFSISHSEDLIVVGISEVGNLGIDIQKVKGLDLETLFLMCDQVLHFSEISRMKASMTPAEDFTRYWTIKEAISKATGIGLGDHIREVIVPSQSINSMSIGIPTSGAQALNVMYRPDCLPGYCLAVASTNAIDGLTVEEFEPSMLSGEGFTGR